MLQATQSMLGLKKGQTYTIDTDDKIAVFKTKAGRKTVFIPISQLGRLKLRAINDNYYN